MKRLSKRKARHFVRAAKCFETASGTVVRYSHALRVICYVAGNRKRAESFARHARGMECLASIVQSDIAGGTVIDGFALPEGTFFAVEIEGSAGIVPQVCAHEYVVTFHRTISGAPPMRGTGAGEKRIIRPRVKHDLPGPGTDDFVRIPAEIAETHRKYPTFCADETVKNIAIVFSWIFDRWQNGKPRTKRERKLFRPLEHVTG